MVSSNMIRVLLARLADPGEPTESDELWFRNAQIDLIQLGLLNESNKCLTDRGEVFAQMLRETPLPEEKTQWVDPRKEK